MSKKTIADIKKECKFFAKVLRNKKLFAENMLLMNEASALLKQDMNVVEDHRAQSDKEFQKHTGISAEEAKVRMLKTDPKIVEKNKKTIDIMSKEITEKYTTKELFAQMDMQQVYDNMQRTTELIQKYKQNEQEIAANNKLVVSYFGKNPIKHQPETLLQCMEMYKNTQQCEMSKLFFEQALQLVDNEDVAQSLSGQWSCDDAAM